MNTKRKCKQFTTVAALLAGAAGALSGEISADFNAYTAPHVIMTARNDHVVLQDSVAGGTFTAWGSTGAGLSYGVKVLGDNTGSNYLNLNSTATGSSGYNLMAQVSTTAAKPLSENWGVKTRFSTTAGQGSLFFGLYAAKAMTSIGGYDRNQIILENAGTAAVALGFSITQSGNGVVTRTAANNMLEFWNGSEWVASSANAAAGLDVAGKTQYDLTLSTDGTTMHISLINAVTLASIIDLDSPISALGSNITKADTIRFSAGDIANNTTDGWNTSIYSLSQVSEPAMIDLTEFPTVGFLGLQKP